MGIYRKLVLASLLSMQFDGAFASEKDEAFCREIRRFIESATDSSHEVSLLTSWGEGLEPNPKSITFFAKRCEHGEKEPGKAFCNFLMKNTVVEFPESNLRRIIACFDPKIRDLDWETRVNGIEVAVPSNPEHPRDLSVTLSAREKGPGQQMKVNVLIH